MSSTNPKSTTSKLFEPLPLMYKGSVKNVLGPLPFDEGSLVFEYTDAYSVFDWGRMPDEIQGKGIALRQIAQWFFEKLADPREWQRLSNHFAAREFLNQAPFSKEELKTLLDVLCREGLRSHFFEGDKNRMRVKAVQVEHPRVVSCLGGQIYDYPDRIEGESRPRLIPLEVVFRFRCPPGSSLSSRLQDDPSWLRGFGFSQDFERSLFQNGTAFPALEPFTKLEKKDRPLNLQEAGLISGLNADVLSELFLRTAWVSVFLRATFLDLGIELADGKLEWGVDKNGLFLVDAIGPDELRLLIGEAQLSKEFLRGFYRNTDWFKEIEDAKREASTRGHVQWKHAGLSEPPALPKKWLDVATQLYRALAQALLNGKKEELLALSKELLVLAPTRSKTVLVVGSGGREHALARKILASPMVKHVIVAPGNPGMEVAPLECWSDVDLKTGTTAFKSLAERARQSKVDLAVIGPDDPLAEGIVDVFEANGILTFGPRARAAQIEASKVFCKEVLKSAGVPTAEAHSFEKLNKAQAFFSDEKIRPQDWVIKADGLALGKGVVLPESKEEALEACRELFKINQCLLIEQRLQGREVSWMAFCSRTKEGEVAAALLDPAQDYKRIYEGNRGPNTGGMGAMSPVPWLSEMGDLAQFEKRILSEVFLPTLRELDRRGCPFKGTLFAGLMIQPKTQKFWVLEFNARFGDPETQVLLPRMKDDLVEWLERVARENFEGPQGRVGFDSVAGVTVVAAAPGYPEVPKKGMRLRRTESPTVFYAGVSKPKEPGHGEFLEVSGGRVVAVTALAPTFERAREKAYRDIELVKFEGAQIRRDIGVYGEDPEIVLFASGRGSNVLAILKAVKEGRLRAKIWGVVCDKPDALVLEVVRREGFIAECVESNPRLAGEERRREHEHRILSLLRKWGEGRLPRFLVFAGYMRIVTEILLAPFKSDRGYYRVVNIHPSLLPAFPGTEAYAQAFDYGCQKTGVTVHLVTGELDDGPICAQQSFEIEDCKTVEEVESRGLAVEHELYPRTLNWVLRESFELVQRGERKRVFTN